MNLFNGAPRQTFTTEDIVRAAESQQRENQSLRHKITILNTRYETLGKDFESFKNLFEQTRTQASVTIASLEERLSKLEEARRKSEETLQTGDSPMRTPVSDKIPLVSHRESTPIVIFDEEEQTTEDLDENDGKKVYIPPMPSSKRLEARILWLNEFYERNPTLSKPPYKESRPAYDIWYRMARKMAETKNPTDEEKSIFAQLKAIKNADWTIQSMKKRKSSKQTSDQNKRTKR